MSSKSKLNDEELRLLTEYSKHILKENPTEAKRIINLLKSFYEKGYSNPEIIEDEIYNVNGQSLTDRKRIELEINNIKDMLNKVKDKATREKIQTNLNSLDNVLSHDDNTLNGYIPFIKKNIADIQALLGIDITFIDGANNSLNSLLTEINSTKIKQ